MTVSDKLYLRSLREIKAFAEADPQAILIPSHDPKAWQSLLNVKSRDTAAPEIAR